MADNQRQHAESVAARKAVVNVLMEFADAMYRTNFAGRGRVGTFGDWADKVLGAIADTALTGAEGA